MNPNNAIQWRQRNKLEIYYEKKEKNNNYYTTVQQQDKDQTYTAGDSSRPLLTVVGLSVIALLSGDVCDAGTAPTSTLPTSARRFHNITT